MLVLIVIVLVLGACGVMVFLYQRELNHYTLFLLHRLPSSNMRLMVNVSLPGCRGLAKAINTQLDESLRQDLKMRQDEEDLLEGLAGLSHDIRTPLAGAKGYLQLAQEESDSEARTRDLAMAKQRLDAMEGMLDQLFEYTQTLGSSATLVFEKLEVISILSSVLVGSYPAFTEKGWEPALNLGSGSLFVSKGNEDALRRIFENVISNMLKHGEGQMSITQRGRQLRFANALKSSDVFSESQPNESQPKGLKNPITSSPLGDSSIDITQVFDRFYRGDVSRSCSGAGLGLTVVRTLCNAMEIDVSASLEEGNFVLVFQFPEYRDNE